jgi:hypothetical protein
VCAAVILITDERVEGAILIGDPFLLKAGPRNT